MATGSPATNGGCFKVRSHNEPFFSNLKPYTHSVVKKDTGRMVCFPPFSLPTALIPRRQPAQMMKMVGLNGTKVLDLQQLQPLP